MNFIVIHAPMKNTAIWTKSVALMFMEKPGKCAPGAGRRTRN